MKTDIMVDFQICISVPVSCVPKKKKMWRNLALMNLKLRQYNQFFALTFLTFEVA